MSVSASLIERIEALSSEVDDVFRTSLQGTLQMLRDVRDAKAVLLSLSPLSLLLLDELFATVGEKRPSDNLWNCLLRASTGNEKNPKIEGLGILPRTLKENLDTIRKWSNPVDHADTTVPPPTVGDAENALNLFLRVLEWFYCEYKDGPQLTTIYSTEPTEATIRDATKSDCDRITFLNGEGAMDANFYRKLTFRGRRPDDQTEIAQAIEILISETLQERVGRLPSGSSLRRRTEESDLGESWQIVSLDDRIIEKCASEPKGQMRALLLTDEPGGGKSTTARNVAWRVAKKAPPFENEGRLPVYIRLRDWENSKHPPPALTNYLEECHYKGSRSSAWPQKTFWEEALGDEKHENGRLFLVLDGLDELRPSSRCAVDLLDAVRTWARRGNVVLLTCRTRSLGAYKGKLTGFEIVRINGFNPEETQQFVRNYPGLANPDHLIDEINRQPEMLQLVRDPFLLDVICYLAAKGQGELPECRSELIEKAIEQLIVDVDVYQVTWPNGTTPPSNVVFRQVLARASLLLRLHEGQDNYYNRFSVEQFAETVETALRHEPQASQQPIGSALTEFYSRTRFLQFPSERALSAEYIGSFSHGLFLDFLAAEGLKLEIQRPNMNGVPWDDSVDYFPNAISPRTLVEEKALDPAWFELLSFLPSRLIKPAKFFEILCEGRDNLSRHRATLALRALSELPSGKLMRDDVRGLAERIAQACWDIAAVHWQMGVTSLAETLIAEISNVSRVYPALVKRLANDLQSPNLQARLDALAGLDRIGMAAVPICLDTVIEGLINNLRDRNWSLRKLASATLAKMGPFAVTATVECLGRFDKWYEQASACEAIGSIGATALAARVGEVSTSLLRLLDHPQPLVRASACEALGKLGPDIPHVEEVVRKMTILAGASEDDPTVRAQACAALGKYGATAASSTSVLDSLTASLTHKERIVRTSASAALGELARETAVDKSHLIDELKRHLDSGQEAKASVSLTLGKLHTVFSADPNTVTRLLILLVKDPDLDVCRSASEAIRNLGIRITNRSIFDRLLRSLEAKDWQDRAYAVEALGNLRDSLGQDEEYVLGHLFENLNNSVWYVRACSCDVLGRLAGSLVSARPTIISQLMRMLDGVELARHDPERYVAVKALKALGKAGLTKERSTIIIQRMALFLEEENWQVRVATCEALGDIGPEAAGIDSVVHGLTGCLRSKVWCVRANACKTLGRILPSHLLGKDGLEELKDGLEALVAGLSDEQQPVRTEAADAVTKLMGTGSLGMSFVLDTQQKIVSVWRKDKPSVDVSFPKPTPVLFALTLPIFPESQAKGTLSRGI